MTKFVERAQRLYAMTVVVGNVTAIAGRRFG